MALGYRLGRLFYNKPDGAGLQTLDSPRQVKRKLAAIAADATPSEVDTPAEGEVGAQAQPGPAVKRRCGSLFADQRGAQLVQDDEPPTPLPNSAAELLTRGLDDEQWMQFAPDAALLLKLDIDALLCQKCGLIRDSRYADMH